MRFSTIAYALLPLLAVAEDITTLTSTATLTRTITVSEVVASVTSTISNTTSTLTTPTPSVNRPASISPESVAATTTSVPENFMGGAANLNAMHAGGVGVMVMIAAALL